MAFNPNLLFKLEPSSLFTQPATIPEITPSPNSASIWTYQAGNDTSSEVEAAGYFAYYANWKQTLIYDNGQYFNVGDLIYAVCSDTTVLLVVVSNGPIITTQVYTSTPGGAFQWNIITANTVMVPDNGYIVNGAGLLTLTLPASCPAKSIFRISGFSSSGWSLHQNALQTIHFGVDNTTTGTGGSISSTNRYDTLTLLCVVSNTDFVVQEVQGNLTVV